MRKMPAGTFKARCLAVMKQVQNTGEPVVVTRSGAPIVKMIPVDPENDSIFGFMKGKLTVVGDIESPIPLDEWGGPERVILLDTHALIWLISDPEKLSKQAASAIRRAKRTGGLAVSAITLWELAWLIIRGVVRSSGTLEAAVEEVASRFAVRPITAKIAALASQFGSDYPKDPVIA